MTRPTDGHAVALVRRLLAGQGVPSEHPWRTTVVTEPQGWVVRTWTQTSAEFERPVGRPQFVHRVTPDPGAEDGIHAELVWSMTDAE